MISAQYQFIISEHDHTQICILTAERSIVQGLTYLCKITETQNYLTTVHYIELKFSLPLCFIEFSETIFYKICINYFFTNICQMVGYSIVYPVKM